MHNYSVALCTFNGSRFIEEQLKSILQQSIPPSEIIISDDGSTDNTVEIINRVLSDSKITYRIVLNHDTHGVVNNFYNAISLCSAPIIFTSDQDDIWTPDKAESMLKVYDNSSEVLLVFSDGYLVDSKLRDLGASMWQSVNITKFAAEDNCFFEEIVKSCRVTGAAMSFKKELLNATDHIPQYWLHDAWLTWIATIQNRILPCEKKLILYRQHGNNVAGMKPNKKCLDKFLNWSHNIYKLDSFRLKRKEQFIEIYNYLNHLMNDSQKEYIENVIVFWSKLHSLRYENDKFSVINTLFGLYASGAYSKYYTGLRGFIRDLISLFFVKSES